MMAKLSHAYIQQHRTSTHTYEKFGKLLVDTILDKTDEIVGTSEKDKVKFMLEFEVSPFEGTDCIRICVKNNLGESWCINQFEDEVYKKVE